jgi:hypothetical protein
MALKCISLSPEFLSCSTGHEITVTETSLLIFRKLIDDNTHLACHTRTNTYLELHPHNDEVQMEGS